MDQAEAHGWVLAAVTAALCFLGGLLIYVDLPIRRFTPWKTFDIKTDKRILVGGLSLGSGVLLFTALWEMFPVSKGYIEKSSKNRDIPYPVSVMFILVGTFMLGVIGCTALNMLIHQFTPESIVHCGGHGREQKDFFNDPELGIVARTHGQTPGECNSDEDSPLLRPISAVSSRDTCNSISSCAGYTNPCVKLCEGHEIHKTFRRQKSCQFVMNEPFFKTPRQSSDSLERHTHRLSGTSLHAERTRPLIHHHHKTDESLNMWSIGVQTAAAIGMHKFPEGFIMFMTSQANMELGILLCLALGIHNIVEGLTIALPLYVGTESRWKALLAVFVLGAGAQPFGSLVAMMWLRSGSGINDMVYGLIFAFTAGFMTFIAISSMLFQAIRMDTGTGRLVTTCFFAGVALIGISLALLD
ncbi:putative zinc transporter zip2 [Neolecta irregularis DAH-3]|uniref:Putative zinc transporter zip2 n=1 Tax=Neolecta irregularis (strain DAH-3) TaxID=1198029 RepID=A0A1U7LPS6_NEOID|nr:putative zinc transporter zip2 [Neolecta irregularis DAH-3]|eukprot:OLL24657.1 putative zinc transporter zip2 [Neolecta irregularis DAH-3]